ncbi:MAG: hypothetical protein R3E91_04990 [Chlamydiales bacterium]
MKKIEGTDSHSFISEPEKNNKSEEGRLKGRKIRKSGNPISIVLRKIRLIRKDRAQREKSKSSRLLNHQVSHPKRNQLSLFSRIRNLVRKYVSKEKTLVHSPSKEIFFEQDDFTGKIAELLPAKHYTFIRHESPDEGYSIFLAHERLGETKNSNTIQMAAMGILLEDLSKEMEKLIQLDNEKREEHSEGKGVKKDNIAYYKFFEISPIPAKVKKSLPKPLPNPRDKL